MLSNFSFSDSTVGFVIDKEYTKEVSKQLHKRILEKAEVYDKINLYIEDSSIEHFSIKIVAKEIIFKLENASLFNKVALVSDRKWIHRCASVENMFMEAEVKSFDSDDRLSAISWIAS
ncbi:MAG: STAS/SEC14 domain-containing protein [Flavobacteriaceae bacterium]|nr:STAS/SEC14 domain-containing protein [Flavobacteriaceae bacterium]